MKKFLQFAGLISAVLAIAAFIFLLAGNALVYKTDSAQYFVAGTRALFGGKVQGLFGEVEYKPAVPALIAWILIIVAVVILVLGVVLPLLKVKALDKFATLLNLVAVVALIVAGVLLFFTKGAYNSANADKIAGATVTYFDDYNLAFAFVFAAILSLVAGVVAVLPTIMGLVEKKK